ncbi:MAG: hypothetical protein U5N53_12080 [Mycobacterium sp.]|nr:hypothetical protein [Mycobacterium sp.]
MSRNHTLTASLTTTAAKPDALLRLKRSQTKQRMSMQRMLDKDPDLKGLNVVEVLLVHKSGNEYKGIATVKESDDTEHDVPVEVTADDENVCGRTRWGLRLQQRYAGQLHRHPRSRRRLRLPPPRCRQGPGLGAAEDCRLCLIRPTSASNPAETSVRLARQRPPCLVQPTGIGHHGLQPRYGQASK